MTHLHDMIVIAILIAGMLFSLRWKKLTLPAAITGGVIGWLIYAGAGYTGLSMLTVFFVMGTAATSWKKQEKRASSLTSSSAHQSTRHAGQVIANAGIAAIAGLVMILYPTGKPLLMIMMAASLSSAAADTLSSELGMVYGRRFINILTGRPDQKGLDGVISIEGLAFGVAGSVVITLLYVLGAPRDASHNIRSAWIILLAGTIGNITDSLLGATLERRHLLSNDAVNFLNTLAAALVAGVLALLL